MIGLKGQMNLGRNASCATAEVATAMCNSQIPCGVRTALRHWNKVVERDLIQADFAFTDVADAPVPFNDRQNINGFNPITFKTRPPFCDISKHTFSRMSQVLLVRLPSICSRLFGVSPISNAFSGSLSLAIFGIRAISLFVVGHPRLLGYSIVGASFFQVLLSIVKGIRPAMRGVLLIPVAVLRPFALSIGFIVQAPLNTLAIPTIRMSSVFSFSHAVELYKWFRHATFAASLHFICLSLYSSMTRLTNSATGMPRRAAWAFRKTICGSVKEIICLCIPQGYQKVCIMSRRVI